MNSYRAKPIIGITLGDPAGIGPEVTAKALSQRALRQKARFIIIGDKIIFKRYFPKELSSCQFFNADQLKTNEFKTGQPNRSTAQASFAYLQAAVALLQRKLINGLVTAPVSKEGIASLGKSFHGHTEFLAEAFQVKQFEMMFVSPKMRTIIVTRHVPLKDVSRLITQQKVYSTIQMAHQTLKKSFKITRPRIAVCGLNPHAGEGGLLGKEELTSIIPAIQQSRRDGIIVDGPFAGDTVFKSQAGKYDIFIAMYHDQGLIPVKTFYSDELVNLTIGLPFIRTSPAHGTAFNLAGKNKANFSSMQAAIHLAIDLSGSR